MYVAILIPTTDSHCLPVTAALSQLCPVIVDVFHSAWKGTWHLTRSLTNKLPGIPVLAAAAGSRSQHLLCRAGNIWVYGSCIRAAVAANSFSAHSGATGAAAWLTPN